MSDRDEILSLLKSKKKDTGPIDPSSLLSTGCTVLNLGMSGHASGGIMPGEYILLVGDSASGKSWICLTILAEAANNPKFDEYSLVYDNVENGVLMDVRKFFGKKLADRIRPPKGTWDDPVNSSTQEEFYYSFDTHVKKGPVIWVLDSMDGLLTEDEEEKFEADKTAHSKGKAASGSYGTSKAKQNSARLRVAVNDLNKNGSILIIVSQTRDNIGFGSQFNPKTRSGGKALRFYAHHELWTSVKGRIKKDERTIGANVLVEIKKNRVSGWEDKLGFTFYKQYGIDDVGSTIDFLVEEKVWSKAEKSSSIDTGEFGLKGSREKLVQQIESQGLERKLRKVAGRAWDEIQEACKVQRKKRYE
jgi:RecA/RadA recombinase